MSNCKGCSQKGLGDTVSSIINTVSRGKIKECGGCKKRKQWLNENVSYAKVCKILEDLRNRQKEAVNANDGTSESIRRQILVTRSEIRGMRAKQKALATLKADLATYQAANEKINGSIEESQTLLEDDNESLERKWEKTA